MGIEMLPALKILLAIQAMQASVGGTVRDEATGVPLAGVSIALTDLNRTTVTDTEGRYMLGLVPAGAQHISVRLLGHAPRTLHALVPASGYLEINASLRAVAFPLSPVKVHAPVSVRGAGLGDAGAFPDRGTSIAAVRSNPLLAEPDVFQGLGGGEIVMKHESPSGINIRGGSSDQTAYVLDGVPVLSPYHTGTSFSAWNPDALSRIYSSSSVPSGIHPAALSGTIAGVTRAPGPSFNAQGSATTSQTRVTVDGPIGTNGAGYLLSLRSTFPGIVGSRREASYLAGSASDWLAKVEAPLPLLGGRVRVLGYEGENEISTVAATRSDLDSVYDSRRNLFEWHSRSLGAAWNRDVSTTTVLRVIGWTAEGDANSVWRAQTGEIDLATNRRDEGLLTTLEHTDGRATTRAGMRLERSRTSYRIDSDSVALSWGLNSRTPAVSLFAEETRSLGHRVELRWAASVTAATGEAYFGPAAQLRWQASEQLSMSAGYARSHQFAQSLRNSESLVGTVFPADLFVGAGTREIPVAGSDQAIVAMEYRPHAGLRIGGHAYARALDGLLLVAPHSGEPFATNPLSAGTGRGSSRGFSLDAALSAARYAIVGSYGFQGVRRRYADSSYFPDHGTTHLLDAGVIVLPTATSSVRLGVTAARGRRTTRVSNGVEWEACNLRDGGCEFGGSPHYGGQSVGALTLPPYLRVDLGVRKHWHLAMGSRDVIIEGFGTITNILNRRNLMTYATDPSSGERVGMEMRPRAPLVVGIDWRF